MPSLYHDGHCMPSPLHRICLTADAQPPSSVLHPTGQRVPGLLSRVPGEQQVKRQQDVKQRIGLGVRMKEAAGWVTAGSEAAHRVGRQDERSSRLGDSRK
eukprot:scaffold179597_cov15-Tisochrysis_lutea.AAC.2